MAERLTAHDWGAIQAYRLGSEAVAPLPVPGIRYAGLSPSQVPALAAAMAVVDRLVTTRLANGGRAVLALAEDDTIAGYGWVRYDALLIAPLHLDLKLPAGQAYIWDCATQPEYRGRGVFGGLLRHMLEDLRGQGIVQAWAGVEPGNTPSLRAFDRAGFRVVARVAMIEGRTVMRLTPLARPEEAATLARAGILI